MAKVTKNPELPEEVFLYRDILEDKQVANLRIFDVRGNSPITDYFIVGSVRNERQMQAAGAALLRELKNRGIKPYSADAELSGSTWVAVDLINCIVHLFTEEARQAYNIEEIWQERETYFEELVPAKVKATTTTKTKKATATKKPAAKKTTKTKKVSKKDEK